jgi:hypothetical protein
MQIYYFVALPRTGSEMVPRAGYKFQEIRARGLLVSRIRNDKSNQRNYEAGSSV